MTARADLRHDGDRCPDCGHLLAEAEHIARVVTVGAVDLLVICPGCHQPQVVPYLREAA